MKLNELKWIIYLKNTAYWILSTTANFSPYFESGNDQACCPVFFCGVILNAICDVPLYLLSES